MAVPKKKTSKSKSSSRKSIWKRKVLKHFSLVSTQVNAYLSKKSTSFLFLEKD